ncbi:neurotrophin receptor-interacting factor homolog [Erpetoichthys calabaricus]|uniref:neurotrophin receptor-interacting factor homolog n=1 Tax=Erpetoichthys calabaricus TaxID=27687 RepID=UPI00223492F6|nr:neurotrophin receptor-interacting factor homolog [Erpetoichthys calabaricus]
MISKKLQGVGTPDYNTGVVSGAAQAVEVLFRQFIAVQEDKHQWLEQRFKGLQHQFNQVQGQANLVQQLQSSNPDESVERSKGASARTWEYPRLMPFQEPEDLEHYLSTFERVATVCNWPRADWAIHLVPLLTGGARAAFLAMPVEESLIYDSLKAAILEKYEISIETYRVRFRSLEWEEGQSPKELLTLLKELCTKWLQPQKHSIDQIIDFILLEQLLQVFDIKLCTWVEEHWPKNSKEAAELAEVFMAAHRPRNLRKEDKVIQRPRTTAKPTGMSRGEMGRGPITTKARL